MNTFEKVLEALKAEGFAPSVEDFGISFKYQMTMMIYMKNDSDNEFFNLLIPYIYDVTEENELDVLRACNEVNNTMKVVKLVANGDSVWVCFESEVDPEADVTGLLRFAVTTLFQARICFYEALKKE